MRETVSPIPHLIPFCSDSPVANVLVATVSGCGGSLLFDIEKKTRGGPDQPSNWSQPLWYRRAKEREREERGVRKNQVRSTERARECREKRFDVSLFS
jgi:hypothetical protein